MTEELKKIGRPKSDDPRKRRVQARFTEYEYKLLEECASSHNLTMTQLIRKASLQLIDSMR